MATVTTLSCMATNPIPRSTTLSHLLQRSSCFRHNFYHKQELQLHRSLLKFKVKCKESERDGNNNYILKKTETLAIQKVLPPEGFVVFTACIVGILTGVSVVLFNITVHEINAILFDGVPSPAASWFRDQSIETKWQQVVLVPVSGGVVVGLLNTLRSKLESSSEEIRLSDFKASFRSFLKTAAATVTLGTSNSLGPEGPSVEIGASIAKGVGKILKTSKAARLSLIAAGSAAGISSGFNAPVAGCFFAVESVLWPSSSDTSPSITNTTSMVILSAVVASVISQAGLGSDPAFRVPAFEFRSAAELPLYLLLGVFSGIVSVALSKSTTYFTEAANAFMEKTGAPDVVLPALGATCVGLLAFVYPEVLYRGFENVNILLESQPVTKSLPADLLLQLVGAKIVSTSLSRACKLVGGYYAPSLFIGAALGAAYGRIACQIVTFSGPLLHYNGLEVAPPEAYGLVGMAATLAGVCQVPLTSVLLLFELTQDYRIIIPLMGAVGFSSWTSSVITKSVDKLLRRPEQDISKKDMKGQIPMKKGSVFGRENNKRSPSQNAFQMFPVLRNIVNEKDEVCELESSLCVATPGFTDEDLEEVISVGLAMRKDYLSVPEDIPLKDALNVIIAEKEWCALVIDSNNILKDVLTLGDLQQYGERVKQKRTFVEISRVPVSEVCATLRGVKTSELLTVSPLSNLKEARKLMSMYGFRQLPVVARCEGQENHLGPVVGLIDRDCIQLACRAEATKRVVGQSNLS